MKMGFLPVRILEIIILVLADQYRHTLDNNLFLMIK